MDMNVTINVEKGPGSKNFSFFMVEDVQDFGLSGFGPTAKDAIKDLYVAKDEIKEELEKEGKEMPNLNFTFKFDVGSLFDYYSYLNISGVAKKAGINASLMRQYASGVHKPSSKRLAVIETALKDMAKEIHSVALW